MQVAVAYTVWIQKRITVLSIKLMAGNEFILRECKSTNISYRLPLSMNYRVSLLTRSDISAHL